MRVSGIYRFAFLLHARRDIKKFPARSGNCEFRQSSTPTQATAASQLRGIYSELQAIERTGVILQNLGGNLRRHFSIRAQFTECLDLG